MTELKSKIDQAESTIKRYEVQQQIHGYVWVYLRKAGQGNDRQPLVAGGAE